MMPAELKSLYRCLLKRGDSVVSCTEEVSNEYDIMISTNVLITVGPQMGSVRSNMLLVHLNPILTGEGWNNEPSK
jgi:hypothetical protein